MVVLLLHHHLRPSPGFVFQPVRRAGLATLQRAVSTTAGDPLPVALDAAPAVLRRSLAAGDNTTRYTLEAYVSRRREVGGSLVFLDLAGDVEASASSPSEKLAPLQALVKRQALQVPPDGFKPRSKSLQPGTRVRFVGVAASSRTASEAMLICHSATILAPPMSLHHVQGLLRRVREGQLPADEVAAAMAVETAELEELTAGDEEETAIAARLLAAPRWAPPPPHVVGAKVVGGAASVAQRDALLPPPPPAYASVPVEVVAAAAATTAADAVPAEAVAVGELADGAATEHPVQVQVRVEGWVQGRRRFNGGVCLLDCVEDYRYSLAAVAEADPVGNATLYENERPNWGGRLRCVLHRDVFRGVEDEGEGEGEGVSGSEDDGSDQGVEPHNAAERALAVYREVCAPGAKVTLQGFYRRGTPSSTSDMASDADEPTLWVTAAQLERSSWQPAAVRRTIDFVRAGWLEREAGARALCLQGGHAEAARIANLSKTEAQWEAAVVSRRLESSSSRMGTVSAAQREVRHRSNNWPQTTV